MISKNISQLLKWNGMQRSDSVIKYNFFKNNYNRLYCTTDKLYSNIFCDKKIPITNGNVRNSHTLAQLNTYYGIRVSHAYKTLGDFEIYANTLTTPLPVKDFEITKANSLLVRNWSYMNNTEILDNFEQLTYNALKNNETLSESKYHDIVKVLKNKLPDFDDKELHRLMDYLILWKMQKDNPVFKSLWTVIDNQCRERMSKWTIDEILLTNDKFYLLRISRATDFTFFSLLKLSRKLKKLSHPHLMHFLFLMNVNRTLPLRTYELEYYTEQYIKDLTLEEIEIAALTFTKYDMVIKSKDFLIEVVQKLQKNIDSVNDITLSSVVAIIRFLDDEKLIKELTTLLKLLESQISYRSISTVAAIAEMKKRLLIYNPNLLEKISERLAKDIKTIKMKDLERIITSLCIFNSNLKFTSLYSLVADEICSSERSLESDKYSKYYLEIVTHMAQANFYSDKALEIVLDPKYIEKHSHNEVYKLKSSYLRLDYGIELDHPEYTGPRLQKDVLELLKRRFGALLKLKVKRHNINYATDKLKISVMDICKEVLGAESLCYSQILLPYHKIENIIIGKNPETGEFISPEGKFSKMILGTIMYAPNDGNIWYALVMGAFHNITRADSHISTSALQMQIRHLEHIGYKPIMISIFEWNTLFSEEDKQKYIMDLLHK